MYVCMYAYRIWDFLGGLIIGSFPKQGDPNINPKYDKTCNGDPQKGIP